MEKSFRKFVIEVKNCFNNLKTKTDEEEKRFMFF